jgi:ELWxxDGT repeat protein
LWRTDGTTTALWADIYPGAGYSDPDELIASGNRLFFSANDGVHGDEPWSTDGVSTAMVSNIATGPEGSDLEYPAPFGDGRIIFNAEDSTHGEEPWIANGSSANLVADIRTGEDDSSPRYFYFLDGASYFRARDDAHGSELWVTDGTGASLVGDILPGTDGSSPRNFFPYRGETWFTADDGTHGREFWKLIPPDVTVTIEGPARLRFRPSGRADLKLRCPASEVSGPCSGQFTLATKSKVHFRGKRRVVVFAKGSFQAAAGSTDTAVVRISAAKRRLLKKVRKARKLRLVAKVGDQAGNSARVKILVKAVMPR